MTQGVECRSWNLPAHFCELQQRIGYQHRCLCTGHFSTSSFGHALLEFGVEAFGHRWLTRKTRGCTEAESRQTLRGQGGEEGGGAV